MICPLSSSKSVSPEGVEAAIATLRSGKFTMGETVERFEQALAAYVGSPHAVMVNSGSSANLLALEALVRPSLGRGGWRPGDEVLVPALSWSTTVWPVAQLGLTPVFVDADPVTLAMDWDHAETMLTPRTVGVLLIHVLGYATDLDVAQAWCAQRHLTLIEDCCEAFGAFSQERHVGTVGALGTLSHYFSHQLTTMEGGTVLTADAEIADDLRSMRSHGWTRHRRDRNDWEVESRMDPRFLFVSSGYNFRPLELQAAMGLAQLAQIDRVLEMKDRVARAMADVLASVPGLRVLGAEAIHDPSASRQTRRHSWMNLPVLVEAPLHRDVVMAAWQARGIETRPIIAGNLLRHPVMYRHWPGRASASGYPVADRIMRQGFMIGCHEEMNVDVMAEAVQALKVAA